ncbi:alpha-hydroxy-acid oxidizing protein [Lutispora saccharofermentans]|uniref:L-lactate oxidase n=1 Tax=Lutispora saccharofermentans TaxID=3024236 RepID=A0ABT1NCY1_9FIRM|nr:alpha-hydroxy-acid oxidizing protein [Lutispora saccharofermentans]MCQ1529125.1 alpha-hydroxy-acid oxidizing protein [Lutispora saccharofermentans]
MNYDQILENARQNMGGRCLVCKDCNGLACRGKLPGPGGKGSGSSFMRNYQKLQELKINMDLVYHKSPINTQTELFGKTFEYPFFAAPISAVKLHYFDYYDDEGYSKAVVNGCKASGVIGFTGDGEHKECYTMGISAVKSAGGWGIPTIKPWAVEDVIQKIKTAEEAGAPAVAMDIDAAGLPVMAKDKNIGAKSVEDLRRIAESTRLPFILKGVMTAEGAEKALAAGIYGIVVSNHGGRVLDHTPATVEVLPDIVKAVGGRMKILIDGGIRSGIDVFKALALGADGVLIGRPYAIAAYGGGEEAVAMYTESIGAELRQTMIMTGCQSLSDIDSSVLWNK